MTTKRLVLVLGAAVLLSPSLALAQVNLGLEPSFQLPIFGKCSISASPASLGAPGSATVSWSSGLASTTAGHLIQISSLGAGNFASPLAISASGSQSFVLTATTTFVASFKAHSAWNFCYTRVGVGVSTAPAAPSCTLAASPSVVSPGAPATLSWTTTNATGLSIDQGVGAVTPLASGSTGVSPTATTTYTGTVTGAGGTAECSTTIDVSSNPPPAPTCTLSANPASVNPGSSSTLSWTTANANSFSINQGVGTLTPASGGSTAVSPTATTTYTGTAIGAGGAGSCSATVDVSPSAVASVCSATDAASFGACVAGANAGQFSEIDVTAPILCDGSAHPCNFTFSGISRPLLITGEPTATSNDCSGNAVSTTGFCRTGAGGGYATGTTMTISNSTGPITIQDLSFDEGTNRRLPFPAWTNPPVDAWTNLIDPACMAQAPQTNPCKRDSLHIHDAQNVLVTGSTFLNAKSTGIQITGDSTVPTKSIWIRGNQINNSFVIGIYTAPAFVSGIHIENNTFLNDSSPASAVEGLLPDASDPLGWNTFTGNTITNAVNTSLFYSGKHVIGGGASGAGCNIAQGTCDHIWIENNLISDGGLSGTTIYQQSNGGNDGGYYGAAEGLEFNTGTPSKLKNVTVTHNYITGMGGAAIELDYPPNNVDSNFQFYQNYFSGNDAVFGKVSGKTQIINEWFLTSGQNESGNGKYPASKPLWNSGSRCAQNTWIKPWDWGNCVSSAWVKPTGTLSVPPCTLANGACTTTLSWSGSGGPYTIVLNNASAVVKATAAAGSQPVTLTSTPSCYTFYSSYTLVASACASGR